MPAASYGVGSTRNVAPSADTITKGRLVVEKPVVEHIVRAASLPWRPADDRLTECGKSSAGYPSITREEFDKKLRLQGQQRAAMSTCMTCWNTATRWKSWAVDPVDAMSRECYGMRGDRDQLRKELWALAELVDRHREEFDGFLHGLEQTADLAARRRAKATRRR